MSKKNVILRGMRDGLPIGLGYFAVSFSLGIIAKQAGLTAPLGFLASLLTRASAGEYGGYSVILAHGSWFEMVVMCLVTNLRYLLMSTALTQKFHPSMNMLKRIVTGCCVTDEIFGISIAYDGYLDPEYTWAATGVAAPMWALGTALGIIAGSVFPARLVSALSVALYGMFIAIIVPPAKKDRAVMVSVLAAFAISYVSTLIPAFAAISSGTRIIILTIVISAAVAVIRPVEVKE